jgi:hypothetical protein
METAFIVAAKYLLLPAAMSAASYFASRKHIVSYENPKYTDYASIQNAENYKNFGALTGLTGVLAVVTGTIFSDLLLLLGPYIFAVGLGMYSAGLRYRQSKGYDL